MRKFYWQFNEIRERKRTGWFWIRANLDATIDKRSVDFPGFSAAIDNAIEQEGFRPKIDGWTVNGTARISHFNPQSADPPTLKKIAKLRLIVGNIIARDKVNGMPLTVWTITRLNGHYTWSSEERTADGKWNVSGPGKPFPKLEDALRDARKHGYVSGDFEHVLRHERV
jgi:hypothetical protein